MTEYQISMLWLLVSLTPCNPDPNSMLWLLLPSLVSMLWLSPTPCSCTQMSSSYTRTISSCILVNHCML